MRYLILVILVLSSVITNAQRLTFRNHNVDTIRIHGVLTGYNIEGHFSKGSSDDLEIWFDASQGHYIACYTEKNYKHYSNSIDEKKNEDKVVLRKTYKMDVSLLKSFLTELGIDKENAVFADLDITPEVFAENLERKDVMNVVKRSRYSWQFSNRYSDKAWRDSIMDGATNRDTFDKYLSETFHSKVGYSITNDLSYGLHIQIIHSGGKIGLDGQYPNPCFQPLIEFSNTDNLSWKCHLNLKVNSLLTKMLPSSFCIMGGMAPAGALRGYIRWYLERKGVRL